MIPALMILYPNHLPYWHDRKKWDLKKVSGGVILVGGFGLFPLIFLAGLAVDLRYGM